jgi:hypothetical protein
MESPVDKPVDNSPSEAPPPTAALDTLPHRERIYPAELSEFLRGQAPPAPITPPVFLCGLQPPSTEPHLNHISTKKNTAGSAH